MQIDLFRRQLQVLELLQEGLADEILYGGAAGGGKSYLLRALAIIWCVQVPGVQVFLFRRKVKDLKNTHLFSSSGFPVLLREYISDKIAHINYSNNYITFANGSMISLNHVNYKVDLENYLSAEFHILLIDESTTFTEEMLRFLRSRMRIGSLEVPKQFKNCLPFVVHATNPRGVSHAYLKRAFIDANEHEEIFTAPIDDGGMKRVFIPSKLTDNPYIEASYANKLRGLGDPDVANAYLEGDWTLVEGQALKELNRESHIIDDEDVCRFWKVARAYDYGFRHPYAVLWYSSATGESDTDFNPPKGSIIISGHIYGATEDDKGLQEDVVITARKIKFMEATKFSDIFVHPGPADDMIFAREQGPSIAETMANEGVVFERADKKPGSRVLGLNIIRTMLYNAVNRRLEEPGLYFARSTNIIFTQLLSLALDDRNTEDVNTDSNDHAYDTLRYVVMHKSKEIQFTNLNGV